MGLTAAGVTTVGTNGRWGNGRRARGRRGSAAARAAAACVPAPLTGRSRSRPAGPGGSERSSPEAEEGGGGAAVPGRPRTKFSAAQLQELERSFREQRYIGASEKRRLAALLNLSQSQVSAAPRGPGPGPGVPLSGRWGWPRSASPNGKRDDRICS